MKKFFLVLFSLIMMCSVSFGMEVDKIYPSSSTEYSSMSSSTTYLGGRSQSEIYYLINNYYSDTTNEAYKLSFDTFIEDIESKGHKYCIYYSEAKNKYYMLQIATNVDIELCVSFDGIGNKFYFYDNNVTSSTKTLVYIHGRSYDSVFSIRSKANSVVSYSAGADIIPYVSTICKTNMDIYSITYATTGYYWDGESYFYKQGGNDSAIPDLTDEQIAEIVERFVNSEAYFGDYFGDDYFITYDTLTGYYRGYSYSSSIDLAIEYGSYDEDGKFVPNGTTDGEAWQIRPYVFEGNIFNKLSDWLSSKFNTYSFRYYSISPDNSIEPRFVGDLQYNYCSNYVDNEIVIYTTKQIRFVGEETDAEGNTETVVVDDYIPKTVLINSETGEEIVIENIIKDSSDSLENIITPNADFSGLKEAFEKYISFVNISSITWLTTAISSMITIFVPFVALGIIIFLINRILNGGS